MTIHVGAKSKKPRTNVRKMAKEWKMSEGVRAGRNGDNHRVHTAWHLPLSGVQSIMMEKLAQPGEGGGCTPFPFHCVYHHVQSCSVTL
jgi:hypothetical protein